MSSLSIGRAWDEAKSALLANRKLIVPVALGLILLPAVIVSMVEPRVPPGETPPAGSWMLIGLAMVWGFSFMRRQRGRSATGQLNTTQVPWPGEESIVHVPPISLNRAKIAATSASVILKPRCFKRAATAARPECFVNGNSVTPQPTSCGSMISYVSRFFKIPSW